jgi:UDP-glucose:(heptosyl)LPS alpha-1,3-glucosyltransferase
VRIAVVDYLVTPTNPAGSCSRLVAASLADEHEVVVFAHEAESLDPRVRLVRVPAVRRPLAALFLTFHVSALVAFLVERIRGGRFDHVVSIESNFALGDVGYIHFCHRGFLRRLGDQIPKTWPGFLRRLDHRLHAWAEPVRFRRARVLVAPSEGLGRELAEEYPFARGKVVVLPNPVDVERFRPPTVAERTAARSAVGAGSRLRLVFVALGQYERKGLPELLAAMRLSSVDIELSVVGGEEDLVRRYRAIADAMGLGDRVRFEGFTPDVVPHLWAADAFALPSSYEVFPLVVLQAAAAGLPLLVTRLHGAEEVVVDGENGIVVERTPESIAAGLERLAALVADGETAGRASAAARPFGADRFAERWRDLVRGLAS